ncbi:hypothetical protein FBZ87_103657 [Nitrospirillum amazonense]|uniref:Uncharacterized protein n=1 Tax=Nitrospirillum amazonense TaxID=28077 RepID=A0A560K3D0_9PROT|nr:hypothetical protein FBZ87_103657 [Nitrospirillum amazonense]
MRRMEGDPPYVRPPSGMAFYGRLCRRGTRYCIRLRRIRHPLKKSGRRKRGEHMAHGIGLTQLGFAGIRHLSDAVPAPTRKWGRTACEAWTLRAQGFFEDGPMALLAANF